MKTIYVTPFNPNTPDNDVTGPSTDSGMTSFESVVTALGEPLLKPHPRVMIYGDDAARVAFSDFKFL